MAKMTGPQHRYLGVQHRGRPTVSTDALGHSTDNDDNGEDHAHGDDDHDDDSDDDDNDGDDTDLFYANSHGDKGPRRGKTAAHSTVHSTAARSTAQIIKAANGTEHCQCILQPSHRRTDDTLGAPRCNTL